MEEKIPFKQKLCAFLKIPYKIPTGRTHWRVSYRNPDGHDILDLEEEKRDASHGNKKSWSPYLQNGKKVQRVILVETRNQLVGSSLYLPYGVVTENNSISINAHVADKTLLRKNLKKDPTEDGNWWREDD